MKTTLWTIACVLTCLAIFYYNTSIRDINDKTRPIEAEIEHYYLKGQTEQWLGNEGLEIRNVSLFYGNDSSKITSTHRLATKPTLVFCASGRMCASCVQFGLNKLIEYFGKLENNANIIFIISDITPREKKALYHNQCYSYLCPSETLGLPIESLAAPFFFVMDTDKKVKMLFLPDSTNPLYTEKYLEIVSRRIIKKDQTCMNNQNNSQNISMLRQNNEFLSHVQ